MAKITKRYSDSYIDIRRKTSSIPAKAISKSLSKRDEILLRILSEVGCTVSELVNIKVDDIKSNSIIIGAEKRKIDISWELSANIKIFTQNLSGFLFSSRQSAKLDVRRVQQIVKKNLGTKPSKIRHARIVDIAEEKGINKAKSISGLKRLKIKSYLNDEEIRRLQKSIKDNIGEKKESIALGILLETGCLISELINIKVEDIKKSSISIGFSKRDVRISNELLTSIKSFVSKEKIEEFIFVTRQSSRISDKRIFQILKKHGKNVGLELNQRILRNTKLATMLRSGEDRITIERELGIKRLEFGSYGLLNKKDG